MECPSSSKENGCLENGETRFMPKVTNCFSYRRNAAHVFMHIYLPQGKTEIQLEFMIAGEVSVFLYSN